jgi:hypothetical protein
MDVVAPGTDIPIALPLSLSESGYGTASGTSFSSPMVAAALAWVWTVRPELEKTQLLELLRRAAVDIAPAGRDRATGFGMLDVPRLLETATPTVDPFEPNEELSQVQEAGGVPRVPLTTRSRGRGRVAARLDLADDPRDVYGVWLPGRRRVVVNARTSGEIDVGLLGTRPAGVTISRRGKPSSRTLVVTNSRARGAWVYVRVFMPVATSPSYESYTATVTTAAATRR